MLPIKYIYIMFSFFFTTAHYAQSKNNVLVCYGKLNIESIIGYKYVILESEHYTNNEITEIKKTNEIVLCYISLGEVNEFAEYYSELKEHTYGENETWNSYYLNLKSKIVRNILHRVIENKLDKGFDGLFLDNIDNYGSYGKQGYQKNDLILFIKELRNKFSSCFFMQNAGLQLLPLTNTYINAIAFESVASNYNIATKTYNYRNTQEFNTYLNKLKEVNKKYQFPIILIEYADDYKLFKKLESRLRKTNWNYFVGKIELQTLTNYSN